MSKNSNERGRGVMLNDRKPKPENRFGNLMGNVPQPDRSYMVPLSPAQLDKALNGEDGSNPSSNPKNKH